MSRRSKMVFTYAILALVIVFSLFPFLWLFLTSIKPPALTFAIPPAWTFTPTSASYTQVFVYGNFTRFFLNSVAVASGATLVATATGTLAAYAFARFEFRLARAMQVAVLVPQIIPPIVVVVPLFVLFRQFQLTDTRIGLILAYLTFTIPLAIWLMIGFIRDIPRDLEEAALIDGCSRWQVLWRVVLPLVAPGLAATAIICFIYAWNEFLYAVILTGRDAKTVPVAITGFITNREILWGRIAAAGTVVLLPVIAVALSVQRYLVRGLSKGAVKG